MLFPLAFASLKTLASLSIATGLGWAFAEVRRFVFHPAAFYAEAMDDRSQGRTFGLISELILGMTVSAGRATSTNYAWGASISTRSLE